MKNVPEKTGAKNFDGTLATEGPATLKDGGVAAGDAALKKDKKNDKEKGGQYGVNLNESDSVASGSASQRDSHRGLIDRGDNI